MSRIGKLPELYVKNVTKPSHLITAAKQTWHCTLLQQEPTYMHSIGGTELFFYLLLII